MQIPGFILRHSTIQNEKMWQFYLLIISWSASFTAMNISVILFLQHSLGSLFYAGVAIALGNTVSFFLDGLFNSLQKRFSARTLFISGIIGMIIAIILFIISKSLIFVFLAAIFFSISFDLVDITAMSYIMAKSLPANYGQNISYKDMSQAIGMIIGLVISAFIIGSSYFIGEASNATLEIGAKILDIKIDGFNSAIVVSQFIILFLLLFLLFFAFLIFDKDVKVLSKNFVFSSFQILKSNTIQGLKNSAIKVTKKTLEKLKQEANQINLKTTDEKKKVSWSEVFEEMTSGLKILKSIFTKNPKNLNVLWLVISITIFSYWDTFLGTFFPIFLTEFLKAQSGFLQQVPGSILTLIFILPVIFLFPVFAKLGDKYGRYNFIFIGIIFSAISVISLGLVSYSNFWTFIILGFMVSISYVSAMSSLKAETAYKINEFYAVENNKKEIDTNISAGPLMMTNNFGNIIGPLFGGFFVDFMGFQGFFILIGILFLVFAIFSIWKRKEIVKQKYVFENGK